MTRKRYRHNVTQVEASLEPRFAAIFGDAFTLIDDEPVVEVETPADAAPVKEPARRGRKTKTEDSSVGDDVNASDSNTDSSEEGN